MKKVTKNLSILIIALSVILCQGLAFAAVTAKTYLSSRLAADNDIGNSSRIAVGNFDCNLVIRDDGSLWGWGSNSKFFNVDGNDGEKLSEPVKVMDDAKAVYASENEILVIKKDDTLWGWGRLMPNDREKRLMTCYKPQKLMDGVKSASVGKGNCMVLKKDGSLWEWGVNYEDQISGLDLKKMDKKNKSMFETGKGVEEYNGAFKPVKVLDKVESILAVNDTSLAIRSDGTLLVWGEGCEQFYNSIDSFISYDLLYNKDGSVKSMQGISPAGTEYNKSLHRFILFRNAKEVFIDNNDSLSVLKKDNTLWSVVKNAGATKIWAKVAANVKSHVSSLTLKKDNNLYINNIICDESTKYKVKVTEKKIMGNVEMLNGDSFNQIAVKKDGSVWVLSGGSLLDGEIAKEVTIPSVSKEAFNDSAISGNLRLSDYYPEAFSLDVKYKDPFPGFWYLMSAVNSNYISDYMANSYGAWNSPEYNGKGKSHSWTGIWSVYSSTNLGFLIDFSKRKDGSISGASSGSFIGASEVMQFTNITVSGNRARGRGQLFQGGIFEFVMSNDGNYFKGLIFCDGDLKPIEWYGYRNGAAIEPMISSWLENADKDIGDTASFTASAEARINGVITYQWQKSTDGGVTWTNIFGATGTSFTTGKLTSSDNGSEYRCLITNKNSVSRVSTPTNTATININPAAAVPIIKTQPVDVKTDLGGPAAFHIEAEATDSGNISFQWQKSIDGGKSWINIQDATGEWYTTDPLTLADNKNQFRCKVTNSKKSTTADIVSMPAAVIIPAAEAPVIDTQPVDTAADIYNFAYFNISATSPDNGSISYQWQKSVDGGKTWHDMPEATDGNLSIDITTLTEKSNQFRCTVTNSKNSTTVISISNTANLKASQQ